MSENIQDGREVQAVAENETRLNPVRISVLVVEDEPATREGLEEMLSGFGFEVVAVGSAEEAEHAVKSRKPDYAIVDVFLPGRSGRTLMTKLREKFPEAVLIGTSGLGDSAMSRSMKGVGADAFLDKPISMESLASAMKSGHKSWH